jgi:hypothetical protein
MFYDHTSLDSSYNKNISDKSCRENQNTHFMFNKCYPENRAVYETVWKKYGKAGQETYVNTLYIVQWMIYS